MGKQFKSVFVLNSLNQNKGVLSNGIVIVIASSVTKHDFCIKNDKRDDSVRSILT